MDWNVDCRPVNNMAKANLVSIARQVDLTTNKSSSEFAETHLKPEMLDAIVNTPGYNIFRQDRNWSAWIADVKVE